MDFGETPHQDIFMIKQPDKSNLCGQCCLGTILDITLEEAIKLVGHKHATRTKELIKHFKTNKKDLTKKAIFNYSLCRVHFGKEKFTHWIIYKNGQIYDPCIGYYVTHDEWKEITYHSNSRITSSIEII